MSKGCLTKRKMQEPRISWQVAAKTKDKESRAVAEVAKVVVKLGLMNATRSR
jgi:hypothetical protein